MGLKIKKIIVSDLKFEGIDIIYRFLHTLDFYRPIRFIVRDFTDSTKELPESDVTVLLDVLEHIKTEELSFFVMKRLWEKTRELLIIKVPFEKRATRAWGHYITFDKKKIRKWAERINDADSLGDVYKLNDNCTYADEGFIILKRKEK